MQTTFPTARLQLFGSPCLISGTETIHFDTRKAVALLAYLAISGGRATRDRLVALMWEKYGREGGQAALRRTLSSIRKCADGPILSPGGGDVELRSDFVLCDVVEFRNFVEQTYAHGHDRGRVCAECLRLLRSAAELYRGDFLAGFSLKDSVDFDDWQFAVSEELRRNWLRVVTRLATGLAATGDYDAAIDLARRRSALDPLDESAHMLLMEWYARSGNRSAAIRQYELCRSSLEQEIGIGPSRSVDQLREMIERGEVAPKGERVGVIIPASPGIDKRLDEGLVESERVVYSAIIGLSLDPRPATVAEDTASGEERGREHFSRRVAELLGYYGAEVYESANDRIVCLFARDEEGDGNLELAMRAMIALKQEMFETGVQATISLVSGYGHATSNGPSEAEPNQRIPSRLLHAALRLLKLQPFGSTVAGENTYRRANNRIIFVEATEIPSDAGLGRAFHVRGFHQRTSTFWSYDERKNRLIGRAGELASLRSAVRSALRGSGRVVTILGDPGIGKTRILRALVEYVTSMSPAARPIWLSGSAFGASTRWGYWLLTDLLHTFVAGSDHFDITIPFDRVERLANTIQETTGLPQPDAAELASKISEFVWPTPQPVPKGVAAGESADDPLQEPAAHSGRYRAVIRLIRSLASRRPVMLQLDDLHRVDRHSLEVVLMMIDELKDAPVCMICVACDDPGGKGSLISNYAAERRPDSHVALRLPRFSDGEASAFIGSMPTARTVSDERMAEILDLAGGNPLFLRELTRAAAGPVFDSGELPESIRAVLNENFRSLPRPAQIVALHAAAAGPVFDLRTVKRNCRVPDYAAAVNAIIRWQIVMPVPGEAKPAFRFRHELLRRMIVDSLSREARSALMRNVGRTSVVGGVRAFDIQTRDVDANLLDSAEWRRIGGVAAPHSAPA